MAPTNISQQTTTTALPLQGELARAAPQPRPLRAGNFRGPLQWALDGPGWRLVRLALDFLLLCLAATAALGGIHRLLYPQADAAPLLAMPPLVMLLFYLRGLYRRRLRALVLDGLVPVLSAVSVAAMAVAMIGIYANGSIPDHFVRSWLFAVLAVGTGRALLSVTQRWAR